MTIWGNMFWGFLCSFATFATKLMSATKEMNKSTFCSNKGDPTCLQGNSPSLISIIRVSSCFHIRNAGWADPNTKHTHICGYPKFTCPSTHDIRVLIKLSIRPCWVCSSILFWVAALPPLLFVLLIIIGNVVAVVVAFLGWS